MTPTFINGVFKLDEYKYQKSIVEKILKNLKNQFRLMGYPKLENKLQEVLINLNQLLEMIRGNE